jgi:hypothetical protein
MLNFKKADGGITAIIIVVIILVFIGWLVNIGNRECNTNGDCGKGSYCGSDFACHEMPVIEKTVNVGGGSYIVAALILGISMITASLILKWDKIKPRKIEFGSDEWEREEKASTRLRAP